ncbi:TPA: hypothetical protein QDB01_000404 [Burkholderia vietnamiensis]|nr:hypothetical protein [Burkholderia vietnamiensis]
MRKTLIAAAFAAALAAASLVVTAAVHAPVLGQNSAPQPFSLQHFYTFHSSTITPEGKATFTNPLAYEPTASVMGLRIGDPMSSQAPACTKDMRLPLAKPCALQTGTSGAIVGGLPEHLGLQGNVIPGVPTVFDDKVEVDGQALVGSDASGRIDAIVVPMASNDVLARVALQGFLFRFGKPAAISAHEAVWDLPSGAHAKVFYGSATHLDLNTGHNSIRTMLYAAVYGADGASKVPALLNADWSLSDPTDPSYSWNASKK